MPARDSASTWDPSLDRKILTCSRLTAGEVIFKAEFDLPRTLPGSRGIGLLKHGSERDSSLAIACRSSGYCSRRMIGRVVPVAR